MNLCRNVRILSVPLFLASLVGAGVVTANAAPPAFDETSTVEAQRVDRVPIPRSDWRDCAVFSPGAQCASVNLPLDYDQPMGAQTSVAVLRIKATDQKHKIGTLFLNPGGPGGSSVELASAAPDFLGPEVLAKFDIVGFDPRGTNYSENVRCWKNIGEQNERTERNQCRVPLDRCGDEPPTSRVPRRSARPARRRARRCPAPCRRPRWPGTWTCCDARSATSS